MASNPNKLSQLWKELKRRNVTRVLTVYIAAAFMILELVSMISEPFGMPEGTVKVAFFIAAAGLVAVIVVSWIYDFHPGGNIVKTETIGKVEADDIPLPSNKWKIASYISFVVIVGLILLNISSRAIIKQQVLIRSIAVLPFTNDGPRPESESFLKGYQVSVHDKLCRIKDLKVLARNSTEQYRSNPKSTQEIASELDVNYLLIASGQIYENKILLIVQLWDANDKVIWSNAYDRPINGVDDHIEIQSEIAQLVAEELKASITPLAKQLITDVPTKSLTAWEFYQKGLEQHWDYWTNRQNRSALTNAEYLYNYSIEYDSTFALAYTGLAEVYWSKNYWTEYYTDSFMDSVLILSNKALSINPELSDAYVLRGRYYYNNGLFDEAIEAYNTALSLNPNDWQAYSGLSSVYFSKDMVLEIDNLIKAIDRNRDPAALPALLRAIGSAYSRAGFPDKWQQYFMKALEIDKDSVIYYNALIFGGSTVATEEQKLEYAKKVYALDSTNVRTLEFLGQIYDSRGNKEKAFSYYKKMIERIEELNQLRVNAMHRVAYAFFQIGMEEKANYYLDMQKGYCLQSNEYGRPEATQKYTYYDLACIHAFRGEKTKALENLRIYNQKQVETAWIVRLIKDDPLLNNIRDEPEFKQIVRDVEGKYQAEHERVRQWLEENEML